MIALMDKLTPLEGYNLTVLPQVRFLRSNRPLSLTPVFYQPGIVIVCQGSKRGFFGGQVYLYDEQHYLAVSVPVPFTMQTQATEQAPLLAIYLYLDFNVVADLILQIDQQGGVASSKPRGMLSTPMDRPMSESVLRFVEAMGRPLEAEILGPSLVREIYFRALTGEQGGAMRAALTLQGQFGKIAKAIRRIHEAFSLPLSVEQLAREAGMSVPSFHSHFKSVTQTSPLQYLKSIRLHQARLLMLRNDVNAAGAALEVGYESASQFGREFKRLFGGSPVEEIKRIRASFVMPPPRSAGFYPSSP
ncbi:AraC family transcriptional regulator [Pseudomonas sp. MWU13-2105]|uniref:AraC family transcriptional regulator n=1 Tax=Pseudomonas sp. MWU13-2105 TaxID=2935074 RepID=UPI00200FF8E9|nr:AraC family transcriptional regulator [Pseudomonas sp. MWU13-2105]